MKKKSETRPLVIQLINLTHTQFGKIINNIISDNGKDSFMDIYFKNKGIIHQNTCAKSPQQNIVAERNPMHILNVARALMF